MIQGIDTPSDTVRIGMHDQIQAQLCRSLIAKLQHCPEIPTCRYVQAREGQPAGRKGLQRKMQNDTAVLAYRVQQDRSAKAFRNLPDDRGIPSASNRRRWGEGVQRILPACLVALRILHVRIVLLPVSHRHFKHHSPPGHLVALHAKPFEVSWTRRTSRDGIESDAAIRSRHYTVVLETNARIARAWFDVTNCVFEARIGRNLGAGLRRWPGRE